MSFGEHQLTYAELNAQANRLAHHLRSLRVKPGALAGICIERSVELAVGLLAILKAGGAYVPLDPAYPAERLSHMLADSSPAVVLTREALCEPLKRLNDHIPLIALDADAPRWQDQPDASPMSGLSPHDLIYVIYTSGSTGLPKGSCVQHKGFRNLIDWYVGEFALSADDAILILTSHSFDLTQKNFFAPLTVGGCVHLAPEPFDPQAILSLIDRESVTVINTTPSAFRALIDVSVDKRFRTLRRVFLGGEVIQPAHLKLLKEPRPEFVNSYGPTECTDVVAYYRMSPDLDTYNNRSVPIGGPVPNTKLYLLDTQKQPVVPGEVGEVYVGGIQVGRGYLNRPELTAERFVPDPFSKSPGAQMYKTGDLGRWLADGSLEYLGRNDFQVKIRGFRIELEEVEAGLGGTPGVLDACAGVEGEDGMMSLTGFLATSPGDDRTPGEWRDLIRQTGRLPDYMIPNRIVCVDFIPLTVNGKKDRKKLLELYAARSGTAQVTVNVSGDLTASIRQLWTAVLGHESFTNDDNFFDVGGTSLRAVQLFTLMTHNGLVDPDRHTVITLFESATVARLAAKLMEERDGHTSAETVASAVHRQGGETQPWPAPEAFIRGG